MEAGPTVGNFGCFIFVLCYFGLEVATAALLDFDRLEERLEVSSAKAAVVGTLDDLEEEGGAILKGLGENLEQIPFLIEINEDRELLEGVDVLLDLDRGRLQTNLQVVIVCGRDGQELDTTGRQIGNRLVG